MKVKVEKKTNELKIKELKYGQVFVDLNWIKDEPLMVEPLMVVRPSTGDDFACRLDSVNLVLAVSLIDGELYTFDEEYIVYLVDGSFEGTY